MNVIVPYDPETPKTRLAETLTLDERRAFARAMLRDVLSALTSAGHDATVLTTRALDVEADILVDTRPLSNAVSAALAEFDRPVAVVMADLPLATPRSVERLFEQPDDVVLAPGLGGGTNALAVRNGRFAVDYHGVSYRDHVAIAKQAGLTLATIDSYRLAVDVDEPEDLVEVLLHGDGAASEWLREAGFTLDRTDGRVGVTRERPLANR
jgi:2-phospho-L-lactate guanylyltransferase